MAEKAIEIIRRAAELCRGSQLQEAISCLRRLYDERPELIGRDRLDKAADDYDRLMRFMLSGFNDPKRGELYSSLLRTVASVAANLEILWRRKNDAAYVTAVSEADQLNMSHEFVRTVLSDYVGDVAMLSLGDGAEANAAELHQRHARFMERLFAALFVSYQWTKDDADFYASLLTSPTVDVIDQQLLTSAISLGCWNVFDVWKFSCLANVYNSSANASVRQRALVGWVMAFREDDLAHAETRQWIDAMLSNKSVRRDVEEMQLQVIMCIEAPADNDTIQREIMPDLIKHSPVRVKDGKIEEVNHDDLTDILHPEKEDEAMQQVEQSMNRIVEMQRQGADIYFGGFRMMKRFDFFRPVANWFLPFYTDHPSLNLLKQKLGQSQLLVNLLENGPFCDSDRYSFAFALNQVIDRLPPNVREMMNSAEALGAQPLDEQERNSASNIRRSYLQDLYRFFNIYPYRSTLRDIFATDESLFIKRLNNAANPLQMGCFRIASMLTRRHKYGLALKVVKGLEPVRRNDFAVLLLISIAEGKQQVFGSYAKTVEEQFADDDEIMAACSTWYSTFGNYDYAAKILQMLDSRAPQKYELQLAQTLLKSEQYEQATAIFYKLYYNDPTDEIVRGLALGQLMTGRTDAAVKQYEALARKATHTADDMLHLALAEWVRGDIRQTVTTLQEFVRGNAEVASPSALHDVIAKHGEPLQLNGIADKEIRIVSDAVFSGLNAAS